MTVAIAVAVMLPAVVVGPAGASRPGTAGPGRYPSFPFDQRLGSGGPPPFVQCIGAPLPDGCGDEPDERRWVWKIDEATYGASGFITFYDFRNAITQNRDEPPMAAPGGAGVTDFEIPVPDRAEIVQQKQEKGYWYDFDRPSFTQDVDSVPADFLTPDNTVYDADLNAISPNGYELKSDWDPTVYHPDGMPDDPVFRSSWPNASPDGIANLFKFAFSVAPGTQFMNMQIDKRGNYYVARRDMQWEWIDTFEYANTATGQRETVDTQFNIQPYPVSDAYGWCGAIPPVDPNSREPMAGQLIKDIAFDVYANDMQPWQGPAFSTEVVPSFVMRSFGLYVVDVTMHSFGGVRQRFSSAAKGVHHRPAEAVDPDTGEVFAAGSIVQPGDFDYEHWFNRVSPFAAGVVPAGAWVVNEGNPEYLQVVPAGTPGAVWHQNKFAGAAFIVRGDMERRVNYTNVDSPWAGDQTTTPGDAQVYADLIGSGAINPQTGAPWKRADWTDWEVGGTSLLPDAY